MVLKGQVQAGLRKRDVQAVEFHPLTERIVEQVEAPYGTGRLRG